MIEIQRLKLRNKSIIIENKDENMSEQDNTQIGDEKREIETCDEMATKDLCEDSIMVMKSVEKQMMMSLLHSKME